MKTTKRLLPSVAVILLSLGLTGPSASAQQDISLDELVKQYEQVSLAADAAIDRWIAEAGAADGEQKPDENRTQSLRDEARESVLNAMRLEHQVREARIASARMRLDAIAAALRIEALRLEDRVEQRLQRKLASSQKALPANVPLPGGSAESRTDANVAYSSGTGDGRYDQQGPGMATSVLTEIGTLFGKPHELAERIEDAKAKIMSYRSKIEASEAQIEALNARLAELEQTTPNDLTEEDQRQFEDQRRQADLKLQATTLKLQAATRGLEADMHNLASIERQLERALKERDTILAILETAMEGSKARIVDLELTYQREKKLAATGIVSLEKVGFTRAELEEARLRLTRITLLQKLYKQL